MVPLPCKAGVVMHNLLLYVLLDRFKLTRQYFMLWVRLLDLSLCLDSLTWYRRSEEMGLWREICHMLLAPLLILRDTPVNLGLRVRTALLEGLRYRVR